MAYGHLHDGFWSPATNARTDDYGGSLDNRLRFTHRVLDSVRAAVGDDFIVGTPRRSCDTTKLNQALGFAPKIAFERGLRNQIDWFVANRELALAAHTQQCAYTRIHTFENHRRQILPIL